MPGVTRRLRSPEASRGAGVECMPPGAAPSLPRFTPEGWRGPAPLRDRLPVDALPPLQLPLLGTPLWWPCCLPGAGMLPELGARSPIPALRTPGTQGGPRALPGCA